MTEDKSYSWAYEYCLGSDERDPSVLLEELMAQDNCQAFGPVHHFLTGAALLTCLRNAQGDAGKSRLPEDLAVLGARSSAVPGAACALWGVCGAAISAGMAYAIVAENAPLKAEGWREGQHVVSDIERVIVETGTPRCCKRDSRIAVRVAAAAFTHDFDVSMLCKEWEGECAVSDVNTVCLGGKCPFRS